MKIKTVKPEKAAGIENSLINAARSGMLKNRLSEAELVNLLEKDSERKAEQKITVKYQPFSSNAEESMMSGDMLLL
jgi:programmed cell death protein 5